MTDEARLQNEKAWENLRVHFPADFVGVKALKEVGQVIADRRFDVSRLSPELLETLIDRLVTIEQHEIFGTYRHNLGLLTNDVTRWLKAFPSKVCELNDEACRNWWLRVNRGAANEIGPHAHQRLAKLTETAPMAAAYLVYYHGTSPTPLEQAA